MMEARAEATAPDHAAPEPAPTPTPASAARAAASRANGAKSRGPTSPQGKERSKFNRLKHGLCAATTVLPGEDHAAFADRLAAWTRDLGPRTDLEGYFVADAVAASWKLDRGRRVEAVALGQHVATAATRFDDALTDRRDHDAARLEREPLDALRSLGRDAAGCRWLLERWRRLGAALHQRGAWDDAGCHDFLALLGHEPSVEGLDHPEARRALAAALALRYPARPAAEVLAAVLARLLVLHCPDPLSFAAVDGQIAALRQARRPEGREARRAAAEALRSAWPEAAAARRNLEAWVGQQVARWEARLAAEAPREAAARAAAVAEAAVDLGGAGQARLRYEQAHRKAFHGALKGLRDEQARRRMTADEETDGTFEGEAGGAAVDLAEDSICGVEVESVSAVERRGEPDLEVAVGPEFGGVWEESSAGEEEPPAVVAVAGPAGADRTRGNPAVPGADRTRGKGRGAAGPSLGKALDASLRPRNRKERKRLAARMREIERAERLRPGRGAAAPTEPERAPRRGPGRPASPEALDRRLGGAPEQPILPIAVRAADWSAKAGPPDVL